MSVFGVPKRSVVIIEDDRDVGSLLEEVFRSKGFRTVLATTGSEGILAVEEHEPMIATIDVTLPDMDGYEVIRRIRESSDTHILMISGLTGESDILRGLSCGADEYLAKPFRPRELRAGIEAFLDRPGRLAEPAVRADARWAHHRDVSVDFATRTALLDDAEIELTVSEFDLLATLLDSKRRVRSMADLAFVLGVGHPAVPFLGKREKRAVESQVAALRHKLGDDDIEPMYIETVRGVGYRLTSALVPVAVAG